MLEQFYNESDSITFRSMDHLSAGKSITFISKPNKIDDYLSATIIHNGVIESEIKLEKDVITEDTYIVVNRVKNGDGWIYKALTRKTLREIDDKINSINI